ADAALRSRGALAPAATAGAGLLFAGSWGLSEIARGYLFTGFPWLAIGYAHVDGPLAALSPLIGVYGVCALAALSAFGAGATAAAAWPSRGSGRPAAARDGAASPPRAAAAATALALGLAPLAGGWAASGVEWSQPTGRAIAVRLLQGNVPQELKFDPARSLAAMQAYVAEVLRADADLAVLPETAWTVPWPATPAPLREALLAHLGRTVGVLAIGMPLMERGAPRDATRDRLTNSVAVIDRRGEIVARYDKRHLVPFGEFVPRGF